MRYWLMKSEPQECSIDDALAAKNATVPWFGVRNYQARNFMRDLMRVGDGVLFYHSSCAVPGIAGPVGWFVTALFDGIFGLALGLLLLPVANGIIAPLWSAGRRALGRS